MKDANVKAIVAAISALNAIILQLIHVECDKIAEDYAPLDRAALEGQLYEPYNKAKAAEEKAQELISSLLIDEPSSDSFELV